MAAKSTGVGPKSSENQYLSPWKSHIKASGKLAGARRKHGRF